MGRSRKRVDPAANYWHHLVATLGRHTLFVDTGAIISFFDAKDDRYQQLVDEEIIGFTLVTSSYVLAETVRRIVKSRAGNLVGPRGERDSELAVHFLDEWLRENDVEVIQLPELIFENAKEAFREMRAIGWDLTDAISYIIVRGLEQNQILSPDRHFLAAGLMRLP